MLSELVIAPSMTFCRYPLSKSLYAFTPFVNSLIILKVYHLLSKYKLNSRKQTTKKKKEKKGMQTALQQCSSVNAICDDIFLAFPPSENAIMKLCCIRQNAQGV